MCWPWAQSIYPRPALETKPAYTTLPPASAQRLLNPEVSVRSTGPWPLILQKEKDPCPLLTDFGSPLRVQTAWTEFWQEFYMLHKNAEAEIYQINLFHSFM